VFVHTLQAECASFEAALQRLAAVAASVGACLEEDATRGRGPVRAMAPRAGACCGAPASVGSQGDVLDGLGPHRTAAADGQQLRSPVSDSVHGAPELDGRTRATRDGSAGTTCGHTGGAARFIGTQAAEAGQAEAAGGCRGGAPGRSAAAAAAAAAQPASPAKGDDRGCAPGGLAPALAAGGAEPAALQPAGSACAPAEPARRAAPGAGVEPAARAGAASSCARAGASTGKRAGPAACASAGGVGERPGGRGQGAASQRRPASPGAARSDVRRQASCAAAAAPCPIVVLSDSDDGSELVRPPLLCVCHAAQRSRPVPRRPVSSTTCIRGARELQADEQDESSMHCHIARCSDRAPAARRTCRCCSAGGSGWASTAQPRRARPRPRRGLAPSPPPRRGAAALATRGLCACRVRSACRAPAPTRASVQGPAERTGRPWDLAPGRPWALPRGSPASGGPQGGLGAGPRARRQGLACRAWAAAKERPAARRRGPPRGCGRVPAPV